MLDFYFDLLFLTNEGSIYSGFIVLCSFFVLYVFALKRIGHIKLKPLLVTAIVVTLVVTLIQVIQNILSLSPDLHTFFFAVLVLTFILDGFIKSAAIGFSTLLASVFVCSIMKFNRLSANQVVITILLPVIFLSTAFFDFHYRKLSKSTNLEDIKKAHKSSWSRIDHRIRNNISRNSQTPTSILEELAPVDSSAMLRLGPKSEDINAYILALDGETNDAFLAMKHLASLHATEAIEPLYELAQKREAGFGETAVIAIGKIGGPKSKAVLLDILSNNKFESSIHWAAIRGIAAQGEFTSILKIAKEEKFKPICKVAVLDFIKENPNSEKILEAQQVLEELSR